MKNPASIIPEAMQAIQVLVRATHKGGVAPETLALVHLRASQINGCSACSPALRKPEKRARVRTGWRRSSCTAGRSVFHRSRACCVGLD